MNLYVTPKAAVNFEMLAEAGFRTDCAPCTAHAEIAWKMPTGLTPESRTILLQSEPPVNASIVSLYRRAGEFLAHGTYCPQLANEFPLTDTPAYPYRPAFELFDDMPGGGRSANGIYFAGKRGDGKPDGHRFGRPLTNYNGRAKLARYLQIMFGGTCVGHGWPENTKAGAWHETKAEEIRTLHPDYVCGLENCRMDNYVSEKFWDAVLSRRLAIYWGAPNIQTFAGVEHDWIFDAWARYTTNRMQSIGDTVVDILMTMSEAEYLERVEIQTARALEFRGDWERRRDWVTEVCIRKLREVRQ